MYNRFRIARSIRAFQSKFIKLNYDTPKAFSIYSKLKQDQIKDNLTPITDNKVEAELTLSELVNEDKQEHLRQENELNVKGEIEEDPDWFLNPEYERLDDKVQALDNLNAIENIEETVESTQSRPLVDSSEDFQPRALSCQLLEEFLTFAGAKDTKIIDMRDKCNWTDYMIIVEGISLRHLHALSERTRLYVKACQQHDKNIPELLNLEGDNSDDWIVLDAGRYVLHFMTKASIERYQLIELWDKVEDSYSKLQAMIEKDPSLLDRQEYLEELASKLEERLIEDDVSMKILNSTDDAIKV